MAACFAYFRDLPERARDFPRLGDSSFRIITLEFLASSKQRLPFSGCFARSAAPSGRDAAMNRENDSASYSGDFLVASIGHPIVEIRRSKGSGTNRPLLEEHPCARQYDKEISSSSFLFLLPNPVFRADPRRMARVEVLNMCPGLAGAFSLAGTRGVRCEGDVHARGCRNISQRNGWSGRERGMRLLEVE